MTDYAYTFDTPVRFSDLDANQHVNNSVITEYLQEARANYFRDLFGDHWTDSSAVVATITVDYLAPVYLDDQVRVDVAVTDVGTASWTVSYRLRAVDEEDGSERVAVEASSVQVAWDRESEASAELPPVWRDRLEAELDALEAEA